MSRSYKKTPIVKSGGRICRREMKRFANKRVRKTKNIPGGKQYRKVFNSWDIHDYKNRGDLFEYIENWKRSRYGFSDCETLSEAVHKWKTWYYHK